METLETIARAGTPQGEVALRRRGDAIELIVNGVFAMDSREVTCEIALADAAPLGAVDGDAFCRGLPERCGVVAIPVTAFCAPGRDDLATLVRFAYCKSDDTLAEAARRLRTLTR